MKKFGLFLVLVIFLASLVVGLPGGRVAASSSPSLGNLPACTYPGLSCKGPDYYYKDGILTPLPFSVHCLGPCDH